MTELASPSKSKYRSRTFEGYLQRLGYFYSPDYGLPKKTAATFNGSPCRKCGNTIRHESNGGCVACDKTRRRNKK